jgi:hypothetical protein
MGLIRAVSSLANLQRLFAWLILAMAFQTGAAVAQNRTDQKSDGPCGTNIVGNNNTVICRGAGKGEEQRARSNKDSYYCQGWLRKRQVWEHHTTYEVVPDGTLQTYRLRPYENESHECR